MDASIGARVSAKGAGALSAIRRRIAQVKKTWRKRVALLIQAVSLAVMPAAVCGLAAEAQEKRPTAREVIAAIQEHVGVPWNTETVDTFKAGNPDTRVTRIAVTMMATMDVLQRASAEGLNFVITHEPTFYAHLDTPEGMPGNDPVWAEKRAFIERHGMIVWRFHDHWHMRHPDGIEAGVIRTLGWEKFRNPGCRRRGLPGHLGPSCQGRGGMSKAGNNRAPGTKGFKLKAHQTSRGESVACKAGRRAGGAGFIRTIALRGALVE